MAAREHTAEAAIWQDVEFGAYTGDLALWEELADELDGLIVEIGAGAGRVSLHLAKAGHSVMPLEADPGLAAELQNRFLAAHLMAAPLISDITTPDLWVQAVANSDGPTAPGLVLAPLHLIQQVSPGSRPTVFANVTRMLEDGGLFAAVVVDESSFLYEDDPELEPRPPDMRDIDGWVYASEPLWLQVDEDLIRVRRLRKRVAPDGEIERSVHDELLHRLTPEQLEEEAQAAGLSPAGRRTITSGSGEADSVAVLLEVPS